MGESTRITVQTQPRQGDIDELIDHCRRLIGAKKRHRFHHGPSTYWMPGATEYALESDQGLPVWLRIFYSLNGPLPTFEDHETRHIDVWLDQGATASHNRLLPEIVRWMNNRGWAWRWMRNDDIDWKEG